MTCACGDILETVIRELSVVEKIIVQMITAMAQGYAFRERHRTPRGLLSAD